MNSFPFTNNNLIADAFDRIKVIYSQDKVKILDAAERCTNGEPSPFVKSANAIDPQLEILRIKLLKTAENYGQKFFIKLVEELYEEVSTTGATGVNKSDFLNAITLKLEDQSLISYKSSKQWSISWKLDMDGYPRTIEIGLRAKDLVQQNIVPEYVLQYVHQAMYAFKNKRHAASLALMTIALEGTLRDALIVKGYNYQHGAPSQDVYQIEDIHVHKDPAGYKVTFPSPMPLAHNQYLAAAGDPLFKTFKIKRVLKRGSMYLEIRQANDLIDYWSSSAIVTPRTSQITGLGVAIDISRNHAAILSPIDLPEDFDGAIQAVRNNLIHLSGTAMNEEVDVDILSNPITLGDFLKDKNKVFDAICTIGDAIHKIYERIAAGTL